MSSAFHLEIVDGDQHASFSHDYDASVARTRPGYITLRATGSFPCPSRVLRLMLGRSGFELGLMIVIVARLGELVQAGLECCHGEQSRQDWQPVGPRQAGPSTIGR